MCTYAHVHCMYSIIQLITAAEVHVHVCVHVLCLRLPHGVKKNGLKILSCTHNKKSLLSVKGRIIVRAHVLYLTTTQCVTYNVHVRSVTHNVIMYMYVHTQVSRWYSDEEERPGW